MVFMRYKKVKISYSFILIFVLNLFNNNFLLFLCIFLVFLLHELGHLIMIYFKKGKVNYIEIHAFGGVISTNLENDLLVDFGRPNCECYCLLN